MGNTSSSEKPLRAPQKLSKPRVGNHASNNTATTKSNTDRLNTTRSNASIHSQRTNSYNVKPPPKTPHEADEPLHIAVSSVSSDPGSADDLDMNNEGPLSRGSKRLSGLIRSVSSKSQPEALARGHNTSNTSKTFIGVVRPKSMMQANTEVQGKAIQWVTLTQSTVLNFLTYHTRLRPVSSDGAGDQGQTIAEQLCQPGDHGHEESIDSYQEETLAIAFEPPTTTHNHMERAPYLSRRSSFGQTPGAATRLLPAEPQPITKASFRKSFPLAPSTINHGTPRGMKTRRQSLPATSMATVEKARASTPSDGDYRQLGGIRFGSLRITNDTSASMHDNGLVRNDTNQWPITPEHERNEQTQQLDYTDSTVEDAVRVVVDAPATDEYAALQLAAGFVVGFNADTQDTANSEGRGSATYSSDTSNSSEERCSSEHDQSRQLSVPLSNLDSGYVSASSLGSGTEPKSTGSTSGDDQANDGSPQTLADQHKSSVSHTTSSGGHEPSLENTEPMADRGQPVEVQRQHSLRARGSAMLSSLLSRKSREPRSMEQSSSRSRASSTHSRVASLPDAPIQDNEATDTDASPRKHDDRADQPSKLKRLLKSRRRSLPHESAYVVQDTTPMPIDAEDKLREYGFQVVQTTVEQHTLRMEQSRDTLKTITSVGSREEDDAEYAQSNMNDNGIYRSQSTDFHQSMRRPSSLISTKPLLYPKPSSRQAKSTIRNSMPGIIKPTAKKIDAVDEDLAETVQIWGYEAHMASIASIRHMAGNSAFDQAFVPMSRDNGAYPIAVNVPPPHQERPTHRGPSGSTRQPLRTRYSAPDFLETVCEPASPGGIDSTKQKPPKTPPPVSLRTRGSKKSRRRSRSQHNSHRPHSHYVPPVPHLDMQDSAGELDNDMSSPRRLSQSLRSFPVQPPQGPPQGSYHANRGYSPMQDQMHFSKPRYQGHHVSWNGADSGFTRPPGSRASHSYNAPTHRGHPIQSP